MRIEGAYPPADLQRIGPDERRVHDVKVVRLMPREPQRGGPGIRGRQLIALSSGLSGFAGRRLGSTHRTERAGRGALAAPCLRRPCATACVVRMLPWAAPYERFTAL